jgi:hypothetical protein
MSSPFKTTLPSELAVMVCEVRAHGHLWPVMRIDRRSDQHVHFVSGAKNAPLGLQVLQEAVDLVLKQTTQLAAEQIAQRIAKPSPAQSPETAASPGDTSGDVHPQAFINEAAGHLSKLLANNLPTP